VGFKTAETHTQREEIISSRELESSACTYMLTMTTPHTTDVEIWFAESG
jgi:hypothetical protein